MIPDDEIRVAQGLRAFKPFSPAELYVQATRTGLLVRNVALAEIEVSAADRGGKQTGRGWLSTLDGPQELELTCAEPWPAGAVQAFGAIIGRVPGDDERRLPCMNLGVAVLLVERALVYIPGGWAIAYAVWSFVGDGPTSLDSGTRNLRHDISAEDQAVADAAVRWLRGLRPVGRRSLRAKPDAARAKMARDGWAIRQAQPALGWDKIAARVGAPSGRTLQRWIEKDRLHER